MSSTSRQPWLRAARILSREEILQPHLGEGAVLDVGCIDERKPEAIATSLHAWLRARCPDLVGVDNDPQAVAIARSRGFDVELRDAACDDLGGPYRLIFAGEIIEHVNAAGDLLRNLARHLLPSGRLLLTTPNPLSIRQCFKILRHGHPQVHARHVGWFDPITLAQGARRAGLEVVSLSWIPARRGMLSRLLGRIRPYWNEGFALELRPGRGDRETPGPGPRPRRDRRG